ncbi:MAG: transketolase [Gammaproteobacteria bacterium]|nr:transketolase [Gammaproteobacteria bacterium]|tara:strand:+ start:4381 stop:6348 length:1968 start_codon:yes stop_codon:yes gene_type:complete
MLSADAVQRANSGHPGMPMGMADIAEVLWNDFLTHNPNNPSWLNRDRFLLSNGHGSMLLYSLLHLSGYDLSINDLKAFRQFGSHTAGHPEFDQNIGIETTTGPLGQGIANAVGMALTEKIFSSKYNQIDLDIMDHYTYVFTGDGCLMEGISHEACSLAGTLNLGKLICFYDDNGISIDGEVTGWFAEDVAKRFQAYGWHVIDGIDGHNPEAISKAIIQAQTEIEKPSMLACKTVIGYGSPNKAGTADTHGAPLGNKELEHVRKQLDWDYAPFEIPTEIKKAWDAKEKGQKAERAWKKNFDKYSKEYPELAESFNSRFTDRIADDRFAGLNALIEEVQKKAEKVATRKSSLIALNALTDDFPELVGGSADLTGSNCTYHKNSKMITATDANGDYIFYGVREFGMAAIMNGMALHGGTIPYGGTFLTFSDYSRNAIRLAAMMRLGVIHVLTHDSIGLGEDGPTHQPIEHVPSLRLIPGINVWRPCDTLETAIAWKISIQNRQKPSALVLTRQSLPQFERASETIALIEKGGYILFSESSNSLDALIIATGSEVQYAMNAAKMASEQGIGVRVVSMPCLEIFEEQSVKYKESVIPSEIDKIMVIEASIASAWKGYTRAKGIVIGMETFGMSAPASELFEHFGFSDDNVFKELIAMIER